jgi:hypothetical protein
MKVSNSRIALAAIALASLFATPAMGREDPVPDGATLDLKTGDLTYDALEVDATMAADQIKGLSEKTALRLHKAQQANDGLATRLEDAFPDTFAGLQWDRDAVELIARFKGGAPEGAKAILDQATVPVSVKAVEYSTRDLERQAEAVSAVLREGDGTWVVAPDSVDQKVYVTLDSGSNTARARNIAEMQPAVVIDVIEGKAFDGKADVLGGNAMGTATTLGCSVAFTVVKNGVRGVATADHCSNAYTLFINWVNGIGWDADFKAGSNANQFGDVEWYTTIGAEEDNFYYYGCCSTAVRDVTGVKQDFNVDDLLFWWGRASDVTKASAVKHPNVDTNLGGKAVCLISSSLREGDSGGPLFTGNTAAGNASGVGVINGVARACFSKAKFYPDAIPGLSVALN